MTAPRDLTRLWASGLALGALAAEAQTVIALRSFGMLGQSPADHKERSTMLLEKGPAFAEAAMAASAAAMRGATPDAVLRAWIRPLRRTTRANVRRLKARS